MTTTFIKNTLQKAINYETYRTKIKDLLSNGKSTGTDQNDALLNYSMLNDKRMDRLDKTLKLTPQTIESLNKLQNKITLLVLSEGWCGDAAQIVPVINKMAEYSSKLDLKIVFRDENEELMNNFLTNGGKAIPKVILINEQQEIINSWGPRPSIATKMVLDYKEKNGALDAEFKKDLQLWYNKDKGNNTQTDLLKLLATC